MCKFNPKNDSRRIDPCMKPLINWFDRRGYKTLACCCGHGKYAMTVVVELHLVDRFQIVEILSGIEMPGKKKFYKKDKRGYYYIPEVEK